MNGYGKGGVKKETGLNHQKKSVSLKYSPDSVGARRVQNSQQCREKK